MKRTEMIRRLTDRADGGEPWDMIVVGGGATGVGGGGAKGLLSIATTRSVDRDWPSQQLCAIVGC